MSLGGLIARLADEGDALAALEALEDLALFAAVSSMGETNGEAPGEYVANASRRFAALAGDEDWLALMTAMERAPVPGHAALERMLRWALERDARELSTADEDAASRRCGCGGGGSCDGTGD